jgi:tetratricopeptide (TPR) repeat protein
VPLALLFAAAAWPFALLALHLASPVLCVEANRTAAQAAALALRSGAVAFALALALHAPFRAGLRLFLHRLRLRLQADRGPYLQALAELRHLETAARQLEAGRAAVGAMDPKAALPHLVRAIQLDPELLSAHYQLGIALAELGDNRQAAMAFRHVEERDPGHAFGGALARLGRCLLQLGDHAGAAEALTRHQSQHGGSPETLLWLGMARLQAGEPDLARAALAAAALAPPGRRDSPIDRICRTKAKALLRRIGKGGTA